MSQDPLEAVRAAERRIAERTALATRSTEAVDAAREDAARTLAAARRTAGDAAAARTEDLLAAGRADREALRAAGAERVEALRRRSAARRDRDVDAVLDAVLPVPPTGGAR